MTKTIAAIMAAGAAVLAFALFECGAAAFAAGFGEFVILGAFGVLGASLMSAFFWRA